MLSEDHASRPSGSESGFGKWLPTAHFWLDAVKTLAIIVGAVILFFAVQHPDAALNQKEFENALRRERAKMVLEWLKEDDLEKRKQALVIIRAAYLANPSGADWYTAAEEVLLQKSEIELASKEHGDTEAVLTLSTRSQEVLDDLARQLSNDPAVASEGAQGTLAASEARNAVKSALALGRDVDSVQAQLRTKGND